MVTGLVVCACGLPFERHEELPTREPSAVASGGACVPVVVFITSEGLTYQDKVLSDADFERLLTDLTGTEACVALSVDGDVTVEAVLNAQEIALNADQSLVITVTTTNRN